MTRLALALALLLGGLASAQPNTYFVPIAARTPATSPVGAAGMQTALALPDPGVSADQSLLFGTGGGSSVPFLLGTQVAATVSGFPSPVAGVVTAPGVNVNGSSRTLLAVSSGGQVTFGTIDSATWVSRDPSVGTIPSDGRMALSATPGGGAALLVTDGFQITRYDLDVSSGRVVVTPGLTMPASANGATDEANALVFDGTSNLGFVGGRVIGDLYTFNAHLDAGRPTVFDAALVSQGRLAPPVSGLAAYVGQGALYLLAANGQGVTVYNLLDPISPQANAFRVIAQDGVGQITAPAGVAVTNLPAGAALPSGVIAVGDRSQTDLALLRWDVLGAQVDGGLITDTSTDPRGDGGFPDGGLPDAGDSGTPGGGPGPPANIPIGPPVPVDHGSSCSTAAGGPALLTALAGLLLLLPRRRQRR